MNQKLAPELQFGNTKWLTNLEGQQQQLTHLEGQHVKGKGDLKVFIYAEALSDSSPR